MDGEFKEKPPIGITPKEIWTDTRHEELEKAIFRYLQSHYPIPVEWIEELNEYRKSGMQEA